ncbi:MAG: penicillin-binding protein 2 [Lachnospiraceae bacterium]|nr:penicillin-binding protein 2 [Lachnospiraceae bacterium]
MSITKEDGERYSRQVLSQQRYDSLTLPFRRGDILDANGTLLATSEKVYNLIIDSRLILELESRTEGTLNATLQALSDCFGLDRITMRTYITEHPSSAYYIALKQLTFDQTAPFLEQQNKEDSLIGGIFFEEEYKRIYPNNTMASDVIGFLTGDNNGLYGLEEYYNEILNGTTGREFGYLNADEALERTVKPAVDGYTIHSTLDTNIQRIVERAIADLNASLTDAYREGNGANNIACVIQEVDTGNILAMASYPNFDLNNPRDLSAYYTQEEIAAMVENDTYYDTLNRLWRNFCISDTYEPGSTAKPFTVAAALEVGAINGSEVFECAGGISFPGIAHPIGCHNDGTVSVKNAIAWSCNIALMHIAARLGTERFTEFQNLFNFGLKTNIDLAGEARTQGLLYSLESMKAVDLATNSFGQNFNVTMIQMISAFSSLINGGYYYEPHLVDKITNAAGATISNIEPRLLKRTVSQSTSEKLREYCYAVVMEDGGAGTRRTGKTARPPGYAIGGKTGTAETLPRGNGEYVISFMGYAPADAPQIAIYVVIDRLNAEKQDETAYATRLTRSILMEVLPYMGIYMTHELSEEEITELEQKQIAIEALYREQEAIPIEEEPEGEEVPASEEMPEGEE